MSAEFVTTRWTRVLQARGHSAEADAALGELCEAYYKPVFSFIWRTQGEENAKDLTQEFFARLLQRHSLGNVTPGRGRFRSYLLASVKNFLNDMRDREQAAKRNPGAPPLSIHHDTTAATAHAIDVADPTTVAPDIEFDRKWAFVLLERALATLAHEQREAGKEKSFEILNPWLTGDLEGLSQSAAAAQLGLTEGAIKVAILRLRRRFRDAVKTEIAATLPEPDPALVADEMSYLVQILR